MENTFTWITKRSIYLSLVEYPVVWKQVLNAVVAVLIPILVTSFYAVRRHYDRVANGLSTRGMTPEDITEVADVVVIPIADVQSGTILAIEYVKRISNDVRVLSIPTNPEIGERLLRRWNRFPNITEDVQLITVEYDYRDIIRPVNEVY